MTSLRGAGSRLPMVLLAGLASGCTPGPMLLPAPPGSIPGTALPAGAGLQVGFARRDITPPVGIPMAGHGLEGQRAVGWRHRLYARAMVLEDSVGERLALVTIDLGLPSPIVFANVARRTAEGIGLGGDRLFLSFTHTHSGPGNSFLARLFNERGTPDGGYDSVMVDFLSTRIAAAVIDAAGDLAPARAGWGEIVVRGATRNRSLEAHLRNPGRRTWLADQTSDPDGWRELAVDDTLRMLRVDRCGSGGCAPAGALSIFAIHGTVDPAANELLDGDVQAVIERGLERHIDALRGVPEGFATGAFHLVANGAEGDVSPAWPDPRPGRERPDSVETRCERYRRFVPGRRPGGPRTPPPVERWRFDEKALGRCLARARPEVERIGGVVVERAIGLFDRLGGYLSREITLGRSVETLPLPGLAAPPPPPLGRPLPRLCPEALNGTSVAGGAEDGRTRLFGWKLFGIFDLGLKEGGGARNPGSRDCQGAKRVLADLLSRRGGLLEIFGGPMPLPQGAHIGVLRIGNMLLGTVPGEPTTETGSRIKRTLIDAGVPEVERAAVLGLTNAYMQYISTAEEYEEQSYEGGSTLYGPGSEAVLRGHLRKLAERLRDGRPGTSLDSIPGNPGPRRSYFPTARGATPGSFVRPVTAAVCDAGRLTVRWEDLYPGNMRIAGAPILEIRRLDPNPPGVPVAWDDRWDVEVRALTRRGSRFEWEARWYSPVAGSRYRLVLTPRQGFERVEVEIGC